MAIRPTVLPEWAMNDVVNPLNGQLNVVEPPSERKLTGWTFLERPNRQWWNWFQRQTSLFIAYFDQMFGESAVSQPLVPDWSGLTSQPTINFFYYSVVGDKVYFKCNIAWSGNGNITTALTMTNLPFPAKNQSFFQQVCQVERGTIGAIANGKTLYGAFSANSTTLVIRETDLTTGTSTDSIDKGSDGQLRISGFYIIEPA